MSELIVTPSRRLGWVGQKDFCPRCFKLQQATNWKGPWNTFPSDYSRFDAAQKNHVEGYIDKHGVAPIWLNELGDITGYIEPPNYHHFYYIDSDCKIKVRGTADLILKRSDGNLVIVDLKSAPPKGDKDGFAPTYYTQVNAYSRAAEERGLGKVVALAIVYLSAQYDLKTMLRKENTRSDGLAIPFQSTVHMVKRDYAMLDNLCRRFRTLYDAVEWPAGQPGCKHCQICDTLSSAYDAAAKGLATTSEQLRQMFVKAFPCQ